MTLAETLRLLSTLPTLCRTPVAISAMPAIREASTTSLRGAFSRAASISLDSVTSLLIPKGADDLAVLVAQGASCWLQGPGDAPVGPDFLLQLAEEALAGAHDPLLVLEGGLRMALREEIEVGLAHDLGLALPVEIADERGADREEARVPVLEIDVVGDMGEEAAHQGPLERRRVRGAEPDSRGGRGRHGQTRATSGWKGPACPTTRRIGEGQFQREARGAGPGPSLSTLSEPCISFTAGALECRPKPWPCGRVVNPWPKMRVRFSRGMPMPLSWTTNWTVPGVPGLDPHRDLPVLGAPLVEGVLGVANQVDEDLVDLAALGVVDRRHGLEVAHQADIVARPGRRRSSGGESSIRTQASSGSTIPTIVA